MTRLRFRPLIVGTLIALCLTIGARRPLVADGTVKIGAIFAMTGPVPYMGDPQAKTVAMLVEDLNARGGIGGRKVELVLRDSQGDPQRALAHARELIGQKAAAIIGPSTSPETMVVKKLCQDSRTVLVSCGAEKGIVDPILPYVFKIPGHETSPYDLVCGELRRRRLTAIALLTDTWYGAKQEPAIEKACAAAGIAIAVRERFSQLDSDFRALIARLKGRPYDAIVIWANGPAQGTVLRDLRRAGVSRLVFQSNLFGDPLYVQAAGPAAEGVLFPQTPLLAGVAAPDQRPVMEAAARYEAMYRKKYGTGWGSFACLAADALAVVVQAMRNEGFEPEAVRRGVENLRGFVGTYGVFNFSLANHTGGGTGVALLTVRQGRFAPAEAPERSMEKMNIEKGLPLGGSLDPEDAAEHYKPVVAVMDFQADQVGAVELGQVTDIISGGLVRSQKYFVVEKKHRENLLKELQMSLSDAVDPDSQVRIGKWLGAKKILAGAIGRVEGKLLVTLKLIDMETSVTESSVTKLFASVAEVIERSDAVIAELCR